VDLKDKPAKYSYAPINLELERNLVQRLVKEFELPEWVYPEMVHRQLQWCKSHDYSIEEAKAHVLKTYIDDINDNVEQEVKDINKKVMNGYYASRFNRKS
jgi:hypothetical protein